MIVPSLVWHIFGAYNVVIIITYIRRGLRVIVPISRAMRRPQFVERQPTIEARAEIKFTLVMPCKEEDDEVNSRVPRFFCAVFDMEKGVGNME